MRSMKLSLLAALACFSVIVLAPATASAAPASLVTQINHNGADSSPYGLAVSGSALWFGATNGPTGTEPYRSDGTGAGTSLVRDIFPGSDSSDPFDFTPAPGGGTLFFADDGLGTLSLFLSTGTSGGTTVLHQFSFISFFDASSLTPVGSKTFFVANNQLWVTDGTSAGTQMLKAFSATPNAGGSGDTGPAALTASGSTLFFAADDGTHGMELWKSDGTPGGTVMIHDTDSATTGSGGTQSGITTPFGFAPIISLGGGKVLFGSRDDGTLSPTSELWKSDGTTNTFVKTLNPGADANIGSNGAVVPAGGSTAYFNANDAGFASNDGLFKSDGTPGGTVLIHDFEDSNSSFSEFAGPSWLTQVGSATNIFFSAEDLGGSSQGQELWKTDGTTATLVKDIAPAANVSSSPRHLVAFNNQLYFAADDASRPGGNGQLWRSDGTSGGTAPLSGVQFPEGGGFDPFGLVVLGSKLFMTGSTPAAGEELFSDDGSGAPVLVTDLNADREGSYPRQIVGVGSRTAFLANDGVNGEQVFGTDGTPAGTSVVKQVPGGFGHAAFGLTALGASHAVFGGTDGTSPGDSVWLTDGTAAGTSQITMLTGGFNGAVSAGSKVFFTSSTPSAGSEPWVTDGTSAGTHMVKDLVPGSGGSDPGLFTPSGTDGVVYFTASDGTHFQLFKSDGTPGGTTQLTNLTGGFPNSLTPVGSKIFFDDADGTHGEELWVADANGGGASMVKDIDPGVASSNPDGLSPFGSRLVFFANDGVHGSEPWISDGTSAGTQLIDDVNSGPNGSKAGFCFIYCASSGAGFTPYNGALYFTANDGTSGAELWRTDGTSGGTHLVKDINAGAGDSSPAGFTEFKGTLYFSASDGGANHGNELWQTDGTGAGTAMTQDVFPGTGSSFPSWLTLSNAKLFFDADDGTHGNELWVLGLPSGGAPTTTTTLTTQHPGGVVLALTDAQIKAALLHVRCTVAKNHKSLVCTQTVPVFAALLQWSLTTTQTTGSTRAVVATGVDAAKKKKKKKTIVLGTLSKRNVKAGKVRYTIKLTTTGRRYLRAHKKAKIVLKTTLTESNKHKVSVSQTINPTGRKKIK